MRMNYVSKIQANLNRYEVIKTNKATSNVLDGSYASVFKGKSLNFDELREYVTGDDVKDIDWKASSRSGKILVRQFVAEKKHNIMFVFDTNRRMLANSRNHDEKRELAIMAAGTLALFVNRNNDYISATYATSDSFAHFPFKTGLANIELMLEDYHRAVTMENYSDLNRALEYIIKNYRRRMVVIIVSDLEGLRGISDINLKRIRVMNDVLMINVRDADLGGDRQYDLGENAYLGDFFSKDKKLRRIAVEEKERLDRECDAKLTRHGIVCANIDSIPGIEKEILSMLNKHKLEKR